METKTPYNPAQHLIQLKGKDYLEVKWRLAWLRHDHPEACIDTQLISDVGDRAVFKAEVSVPNSNGGGSATGWGSESVQDFGDYLEKAETKALGRALAALGYGTQFCSDFDEGDRAGEKRVADAPVQRPPTPARTGIAPSSPPKTGEGLATEKQRAFIGSLQKQAGWSASDLASHIGKTYPAALKDGKPSTQALTMEQASELIGYLKEVDNAADLFAPEPEGV